MGGQTLIFSAAQHDEIPYRAFRAEQFNSIQFNFIQFKLLITGHTIKLITKTQSLGRTVSLSEVLSLGVQAREGNSL